MNIHFRAQYFVFLWLACTVSTAPAETRMRVSATSTPVFSQPSANAHRLGQVSSGEILFLSRIDGDWAAISPPDRFGLWLNKDFVEGNRVIARSIQVRAGPGIQYDVVGTLERGAPVMPRSEDGEWCQIAPPSSSTVWVQVRDLSEILTATTPIQEVAAAPVPVPPPPPPPPAPTSPDIVPSPPNPPALAPTPISPASVVPTQPVASPIAPSPEPMQVAAATPDIPPTPPPNPPSPPSIKVAPSTPQADSTHASSPSARTSSSRPTPPSSRPEPPKTTSVDLLSRGAAPSRPIQESPPPSIAMASEPSPQPVAPPPQVTPPPPAPPKPSAPTLKPATALPAADQKSPATAVVATPTRPAPQPTRRPARTTTAGTAVPAPASTVVTHRSPEVTVEVDSELVEDLELDDSIPKQGKPVQVEGELRTAPFMAASPSRYRLLAYEGQILEMVCHIHGHSDELRQFIGKGVSIRGREYWVETSDMPVVVVGKIVPLAPANEPVMF